MHQPPHSKSSSYATVYICIYCISRRRPCSFTDQSDPRFVSVQQYRQVPKARAGQTKRYQTPLAPHPGICNKGNIAIWQRYTCHLMTFTRLLNTDTLCDYYVQSCMQLLWFGVYSRAKSRDFHCWC